MRLVQQLTGTNAAVSGMDSGPRRPRLSRVSVGPACMPARYLGTPLGSFRNSRVYWSEVAADLGRRASKWKHRDLSIVTRATVCNVFLTAKLWYVLQVLHCAHRSVETFHRVIATFIWCSGWGPMRRDNLFRRVS